LRYGLVACLLLVAGTTQGIGREPEKAQTDPAPGQTFGAAAKMAQEAMDGLKVDGIPGFVDVAFSGRKGCLPKADAAAGIGTFSKVYEASLARQGKALGEIELVRTDTVGHSVVRFVYAEKLERGLILWDLSFYRGSAGEWRWVAFRMNDAIEGDFRIVKSEEPYRGAEATAQQAADALKSNSLPKLLDVALAERNTLIKAERTEVENAFTLTRDQAIAKEGQPLGEVELVRTEAIGSSMVRLVYLEKCERGAHVWKFTLYRAGREWKWTDLKLNDYGNEFVSK
jgi:hypothetical protein